MKQQSVFNWRNEPSQSGVALMRGVGKPSKAPLLASLDVPQRKMLAHVIRAKQQPGVGVFASV